ncbi:hypothetical protein SynROS8604_02383 [Synechococcus sp. ROS8604]|nr:hypothetical protein SynROS8604_02383 [Synechococcus sp. ROS8604]
MSGNKLSLLHQARWTNSRLNKEQRKRYPLLHHAIITVPIGLGNNPMILKTLFFFSNLLQQILKD